MRYLEEFTDERLKVSCIHCGDTIANVKSNRDHVPTQSLLTTGIRERGAEFDRGVGAELDYLPQVVICRSCNSSFSEDETYLLCVLHAVMAGSLYPDPVTHPEASNILRSNRHVVRSLKRLPNGQLLLFNDSQPFTLYPDPDRIRRVIVKNARGHAFHEIGEPLFEAPEHVAFVPLEQLSAQRRSSFEATAREADLATWPEVGSRMMLHLVDDKALIGGWMVVEAGHYRYSVDWSDGVTVRTVIWDYLATETRWDR